MVKREDLNCKQCTYIRCDFCTVRKSNRRTARYRICGLYREKLTDLSQVSQITSPTCKNLNNDYADVDQFVCSECGIELQGWHRVERDEDTGEKSFYEYALKYCPNCGRRNEYDN